jgi:hypothetical protein
MCDSINDVPGEHDAGNQNLTPTFSARVLSSENGKIFGLLVIKIPVASKVFTKNVLSFV